MESVAESITRVCRISERVRKSRSEKPPKMTNEAKRNRLIAYLGRPHAKMMSNRMIAEECGCSHMQVKRVRDELFPEEQLVKPRIGIDGRFQRYPVRNGDSE